jgi:hypothetical protein
MAKLKDDEIKWILSLNASKAQQEIHKLATTNKDLTNSNKDLKKAMLDLEAQGKKNSDEWKNLKKSYDDNSAAIALNNQRINEMQKSMGLADMTMSQLRKRASELQRQLDNTSQSANPEEYARLQRELGATRERMVALRNSGRSLSDQLGDIPGPAGQVINSVKGMASAMKLLIANPVGLVITLIAGALMLLYKAFKSTDSGATSLAGIFKGLGNVMDVLIDRTVSFYKMLLSILTLDIDGIKKNAQDAFGGAATAIRDAASAGYEYEQIMDSIGDRESAALIRSAKLRAEIESLKNQSKNALLPIQERIRLNDLAQKKERELLEIEKGFKKERLQAEILNLAGTAQIGKLSLAQKKQQIQEWLKLDDRRLGQYMKENAAFADFYDKNEEAFQALQKLKSEEIMMDADFQKETRRLTSEGFKFKKELQAEEIRSANEAAKEREKELKKQADERKKILSDTQIIIDTETIYYNERLKKAGIYGVESNKLTADQLMAKQQIENEYQQKITKIAVDAEKARLKEALKAAGLDGDVSKLTGEKLLAYERLMEQHENNLQKITDTASNNKIQSQKETDAALLNLTQKAGEANLKAVETVQNAKTAKLKSDLADDLISQQEYDDELKEIEAEGLAERLTAQERYIEQLKQLTQSDEQKKELEAAQAAMLATQNQINDSKIAKEKAFQEKRKAVIQQYGLNTLDETFRLEMDQLEKQFAEKLLSEEEFERAKLQLKIKSAQGYASQVNQIVQAASNMVQAIQTAETSKVQADYAKRLSNLNKSDADYAAKKEQLQYEQAVAELEVQKKYADFQFGMQVAQIGVATATGIMNAWSSSMVLGPVLGPIAAGILTGLLVTTGIAQIAAANAERQKIKASSIESPSSGGGAASGGGSTGSVSYGAGFADGGYTGNGGKYQIAGYLPNGAPFHRGEYFVAQEEMRNPKLIPFIRQIDEVRAQRVGSRSLPAGYGAGYADGGYTGGSRDSILLASTVAEFKAAVREFAATKFRAEINYWEWKEAEETINNSQSYGRRAS